MTKAQAEAILSEQEHASADENTEALRTVRNSFDTLSGLCSTAHGVCLILAGWTMAKSDRLKGKIARATHWETEADRIIRKHGFDW